MSFNSVSNRQIPSSMPPTPQPQPTPKSAAETTISRLGNNFISPAAYPNPRKRLLSRFTDSVVTSIVQPAINGEKKSEESPRKKQRLSENDSATTTTTTSKGKNALNQSTRVPSPADLASKPSAIGDESSSFGISIDGQVFEEEVTAPQNSPVFERSILGIIPREVVMYEILPKLNLKDILNFEGVSKAAEDYTQTFWKVFLTTFPLFHNSSLFPLIYGRERYMFNHCVIDLTNMLAGAQQIEDAERAKIFNKYNWLNKRIPLLHDFLNFVTFKKNHPSITNIYSRNVEELVQRLDQNSLISLPEWMDPQSPEAVPYNTGRILSSIANDDWRRALPFFLKIAKFNWAFDKVLLRIFSKEAISLENKKSLFDLAQRRMKNSDNYALAIDIINQVPGFNVGPPNPNTPFYTLSLLIQGIRQSQNHDYEAADKTFDEALAKISTNAYLGPFALQYIIMTKVEVKKFNEAATFVDEIKRCWTIPKTIPQEYFFRTYTLIYFYLLTSQIEVAEELFDRFPAMDFFKNETIIYTGAVIKFLLQKSEKAEHMLNNLVKVIEDRNPGSLDLQLYRFKLAEVKYVLEKYIEAEQLLDRGYSDNVRSSKLIGEPILFLKLAKVKRALYKYDEMDSYIKMAQGFYIRKAKVVLNRSELTWDECLAADRAGDDEIPYELEDLVIERFGK